MHRSTGEIRGWPWRATTWSPWIQTLRGSSINPPPSRCRRENPVTWWRPLQPEENQGHKSRRRNSRSNPERHKLQPRWLNLSAWGRRWNQSRTPRRMSSSSSRMDSCLETKVAMSECQPARKFGSRLQNLRGNHKRGRSSTLHLCLSPQWLGKIGSKFLRRQRETLTRSLLMPRRAQSRDTTSELKLMHYALKFKLNLKFHP